MIGSDTSKGVITDPQGPLNIGVGRSSTAGSFVNDGTLSGTNVNLQIADNSQAVNHGTLASQGAGGILVTGGTVTNSGLISASTGSVSFSDETLTNTGTMLAASAGGAHGNILVVSGTFNNAGLFKVEQGATATVGFKGSVGTMTNSGTIEVQGNVEIYNKTTQTGHGVTKIDGGDLKLDSGFQDGTIAISSGMLEFGAPNLGPFGYGVGPAQEFAAAVDFTGKTGSLVLDGFAITSESVSNDILTVFGTPTYGHNAAQEIATITLTGHSYATDNFSISGSTLAYHQT